MANSPSSKKRVRQIKRKTLINASRRSRIKSFIRKIEDAINTKDYSLACESFKKAQPEIMRGVTKGIFHKNTASRKISRLSKRICALKN